MVQQRSRDEKKLQKKKSGIDGKKKTTYLEFKLFGEEIRVPKQKRAVPLDHSTVPMEVPQVMREAVAAKGGEEMVFVAKKILKASDVKPDQERLFVPKTTSLMESLTFEEIMILERSEKVENGNKKGRIEAIDIGLVDAAGRFYEKMEFKRWPTLDQLIFTSDWNAVVRNNNLKPGDRVDIHVFRYGGGKLGIGLNIDAKNLQAPMDIMQQEGEMKETEDFSDDRIPCNFIKFL